ncbi:MAG: amidase [Chloroflexota bacterium]|nr:amidase [Chloroflexota bacterium]
MTDELYFASATWLAERLRTGELSSLEVVDAYLARIEQVNPRLNAVVRLNDAAREEARRADQELASGAVRGPLHGLPFTAKDSLDTAGVVTTAGTVAWRERIPTRDATVVRRVRAAGGILLGKTNTPEFTWSSETDNDVYGKTSNPYDLSRSPGGSSGGPAAIVAAGGSPFDIGSDTGDSIRQPSHVCGIAGLKPTSGRVPRTGHWPGYQGLFESFTQLGPMARRVEDLELLLPILAGPDGEDPHVPPVALRDPSVVDIASLRVVAFTNNGIQTPTAETVSAVEAAVEAITGAGAKVRREVPPGLADAWAAWDGMIRADGFAWLHRLIAAAGTEGWGSYATRDWITPGAPLPGDELTDLIERADAIRARLLHWVQDVDLIVCPVAPHPAIRHGQSSDPRFNDTYSDVHNLTGWPAAVVRGGSSGEGLPIGVQLIAQPWREDVALAGARVVEAASGGWQPPTLW